MIKTLSIFATTALLLGAATESANAWTRDGHVHTPRGTYSGHASGGCAGGTCSRSKVVTGPYGNSASRSGYVTRTGPDSYSYGRTTTGPRGNTVSRSGSVSRY